MTYDHKRSSLEKQLECCEHQRQTFVELHQGEFMRANELEERVRKLKKAQRAAQISFMGTIV